MCHCLLYLLSYTSRSLVFGAFHSRILSDWSMSRPLAGTVCVRYPSDICAASGVQRAETCDAQKYRDFLFEMRRHKCNENSHVRGTVISRIVTHSSRHTSRSTKRSRGPSIHAVGTVLYRILYYERAHTCFRRLSFRNEAMSRPRP
jgi:hypothetical protein